MYRSKRVFFSKKDNLLSCKRRHCSRLSRRRCRDTLTPWEVSDESRQNITNKNKITHEGQSCWSRSGRKSVHFSYRMCATVSRTGAEAAMTVKTLAASLVCVCRLDPYRSAPRASTAEENQGRRASGPRAVEASGGKLRKERKEKRGRKRISLFQERSVDRTFSFVALIQQPV